MQGCTTKGNENYLWGVIRLFFIVVVVSQVLLSKFIDMYILNVYNLLYINYSSINC